MIPIKLTLHNFMCYRDNVPPINFDSIHTACISGNNGNGKSALIDAITWALWGQTRAISDDELIHSGQSEVEVDFEFAVGQQHYRIIRKHSKPKSQKSSGQTILEYQVATSEGYRVLSGDTTTQTQQKIIQLLHMDYDTFINSAFLRQGRADEFTKKRPGERKQVLGNILQLSIYDELEIQAKEMTKEQETVITQLETAIRSMQEDLVHKPAYQVEFEQANNELSLAEKHSKEQESRLTALRKEKESIENKKTQLAELAARIKDIEHNYKLWSEQAQKCQLRINNYEDLISRRETISEQYTRFIDTRKQVQGFDQKLKQVNALIQSQHRLEIVIIKAGEDLNREHAISENRIRELEIISRKLPQLQEQMKELSVQLQDLDTFETKLQEQRESSKLLRARVHFLQAEQFRLIQDIAQIEEKLKMLSNQEGITCPLCETELGTEGQKRIETKYTTDRSAKNEALKNNRCELAQKEAEVRKSEMDILQTEAKLKHDREIAQSKHGNLSKAISDSQEAAEKIQTLKISLDDIEKRLARRDFAVNEQAALTLIEKEIASIGYNSQRHEILRAQLTRLEQFEAPKRQLEEAERLIIQEKETASKACQTIDELLFKLESDRQRSESLQLELEGYSKVATDLMLAEIEYQKIKVNQKRIQEVMGGAKAKLELLNELEGRQKEKENQLSQAVKQEKIFKDLAQAFGKKGIQAMLIEMAIPEIEAEANRLLSRMTDNRMNVKIETQRETKKGDVMETLDINISDELGTRNYEMFSGGEAFRIDFAIRIALSKLLARRAGAPLPTLIIDEGFGTQDNNGIEKIKEAITSIQDDFEKILVITHISDFKDAFPMRIEVTKTPEGSTVYLN